MRLLLNNLGSGYQIFCQKKSHIGDSYAADYCGAKRFGFQALLLDRSDNPSVVAYQDWLEAPDYEGKTVEEVQGNTITSLDVVASMLRAPKTIESV